MAVTYYVRTSGSDGAAGTSPATAWATIGKALGASGIASGDTVYIGAGVYRETISLVLTSPTVETFVIGDTDGSHTGDAGEVVWTAYTTDDKTAAGSVLIDTLGRDHMTFQRITFVSGTGTIISTGGAFSTSMTFTDCAFITWSQAAAIDVAFGVNAAWLFDRCRMFVNYTFATIILGSGAGSDYDANIVFRNCHMTSLQHGVQVTDDSGGAKLGGGVIVDNCTCQNGSGSMLEVSVSSTSIPCRIRNSIILSGDSGLVAGSSGMIVENYNVLVSAFSPGNVSQGANSIWNKSYAPLFQIGQELAVGSVLRPFLSPMAGSPLLAFGGTAPSVDILNAPRPAGGASPLTAVGAYERGNTFAKETGTVRSGANAISITGPGYQDYRLRVNPVSTTVTVYVRWDATYAGTKPKLQVLHGTEAGVADATALAVGGSGSWEQLAITFTPTSQGIVTIRFLSSDTNGGGKMFVDDLLSIP